MIIDSSTIKSLQVSNLNGKNNSLKINESEIGDFKINVNALTNISVIGKNIELLELIDSNDKESILNIEKTTIKKLKFNQVYNNGLITLRGILIPSEGIVSFMSSNLGKTDFIYCNFSKAILEFENTKITEAFFSETEFPKKVIVNSKINHGQAQLIFGQLATAFQRQGDNVRALEYTSRELQAHYKTLKWISSHFFNKLNLFLNFISNNFGRNWGIGVLFSLLIGFIFFSLLLISTDKYSWGIPSYNSDLLPAYFKFMNPLRFIELEDIFKNTPEEGIIKLNSNSYLADFIGRIFVAYGYYQTIQAFRRFGRK